MLSEITEKGNQAIDLSVIIVNWNTRELTLECIESVYANKKDFSLETIVVDNGSQDGSVEAIREAFPLVQILENRENAGFARAVNQGLKIVQAPFILLLNSDARLTPAAIKSFLDFMKVTSQAAVAGGNYLNEDSTPQNSFDNYPKLFSELLNKSLLRIVFPAKYPSKKQQYEKPLEVESVIGAAIVLRRSAIEEVGLLDEDYFFFLEETDWCLRMRKEGWKVFHLPEATIYHLQGQSKEKDPARAWIEYYRSLYLFFKKHRSPLSYITLRILRVLKLCLNWIFTLIALILTFGTSKGYRRKMRIYSYLLLWHLKLCPEGAGLKEFRT
ncbi:MAG: glycosyltransferase family 2 protein [Proteobacteria bacterium]|nr:glycosyltransferase family 2 protein [Pseudomonadota bacterium]